MEQPYVAYALLPSLIQRLAPRPRSGHRERDGYACTSVLDVAGDSTARDPGRVSAARASFGQDEPSPAVDELTHHVEMTGVACGLGHHMQDNFPQIVKAPVAEEVGGPPGRWGIQRSGGDDGVRAVDLLPVQVEHSRGRHIHPDDASSGASASASMAVCSPATTQRNQNCSTSRARCCTSPRQVHPDGRTGRRRASSSRPSSVRSHSY